MGLLLLRCVLLRGVMSTIRKLVSYCLLVLGLFILLLMMEKTQHTIPIQLPKIETRQEFVSRIQNEMPDINVKEEPAVQATPVQPIQPVQNQPKPKKQPAQPSREETRYDFIAEVTAYTAYDEGMNGKGITASGVKARPYHTIAMSKKYPFGTKVKIEGFDCVFVVEDRGGAITGNDIDIFMATKQEALNFGRRNLKVKIIK